MSVPRPAGCLLCHGAFTTWKDEGDLGDDIKYEGCHFDGQFGGFLLSPTPCHWPFLPHVWTSVSDFKAKNNISDDAIMTMLHKMQR